MGCSCTCLHRLLQTIEFPPIFFFIFGYPTSEKKGTQALSKESAEVNRARPQALALHVLKDNRENLLA